MNLIVIKRIFVIMFFLLPGLTLAQNAAPVGQNQIGLQQELMRMHGTGQPCHMQTASKDEFLLNYQQTNYVCQSKRLNREQKCGECLSWSAKEHRCLELGGKTIRAELVRKLSKGKANLQLKVHTSRGFVCNMTPRAQPGQNKGLHSGSRIHKNPGDDKY